MVEALIFISLDRTRDPKKTAKAIAAIDNVVWARLLFGPIDCAARIEASDMAALETTVFEIRGTKGVSGTDTRPALG